jgi:glycosyltransferase involved in cell wall biosynthesis
MDVINNLKCRVAKLENGKRVSPEEYHQKMFNSKIIFAPFGYGEMAPRDLEAAMYGSILLKPDMGHLQTSPNVYIDGETYISCKHDYSDLEEKIDNILGNDEKRSYIIENARKKFQEIYTRESIALHLYNIFNELKTVEVE